MGKTSWDDFMRETVFDLLAERKTYRARPGEVLTSLASEIPREDLYDRDSRPGACADAISKARAAA